MTDISGKVIWITGASSGIGEALALAASQHNAKLILSARREAELERVRAACRHLKNVAVLPLDLTDLDVGAALAKAESFFGPVDVLVNNAGISQRSSVLETSMDVYRRIFELDFFAPVALTKAVLPGMVERGGGHIVTISSVVGYVGTPQRSGYAAAKHAIQGFVDAARAELWKQDVRFTTVCPGYVRTNVSINAITGSGGSHGQMDRGQDRGMDAGLCARKIWSAVAADRDEISIGKEALIIWAKRFVPGLVSYGLKRARVT
jgi:dehydrogenase/reductase SDR family protein 7B